MVWPDNQGVPINAHGGGVIFFAGRYFWFGKPNLPGRSEAQMPDGRRTTQAVVSVSAPTAVAGPWHVSFAPGHGAPEAIVLPRLIPLAEHPDAGVRHSSGIATYRSEFLVPPTSITRSQRCILDLGDLHDLAAVELNGESVSTVWRSPFRVDVTDQVRAGINPLVIRVANRWVNRMIGGEALPPEARYDAGSNSDTAGAVL